MKKTKTRKQKGGFNVIPLKNNAFKYTKDEKRKLWNKHTYPIGQYLIQLVQSIPWKEYSYEGKMNFLYYIEDEDDNLIPAWKEHTIKTKPIDKFPYYFFGGCVYEILNNEFKQLNNSLHNYTDPTGDIDVRFTLPNIKINEKIVNDYSDFLFEPDGKDFKMNAFVDDYTKWIFNQVKKYLTELSKRPLFNKIFADTVEFDYKDEPEGEYADLYHKIENLWLVRTVINGFIKIQITIKYKDMEEPDHILEINLPAQPNLDEIPDDVYRIDSLDRFTNKYIVLKDKIPIESFSELYMANARAGKERLELLDGEGYHHKFYNHIQRSLFLNKSLPKILNAPGESDINKITITDIDYHTLSNIIIYRYINFIIDNKDTICKFLYTHSAKSNDCNKLEVLKYLTDGIDKIIFKLARNNKGNRILYFPIKYTYSYEGKEVDVGELFDILQGIKKGGGKQRRKTHKNIKNRI